MNFFSPILSLVLLFCIRVSGQCWQAATYSESVVSPELRSSSILRVPDVSSLAQCAGACCDLSGCDLAWFFERRCYVLSCQHKENCQPKQRPGTDSLLAFLQRGPPQTLVLQSLVRGESFPNHWQPLPRHRGSEDPMKDFALLEGIQDLDNTDAEYAESFRSLEDKRAEDRDAATVEQEERPGLYDWPIVQGKEEFNQSETERVGERLTTVQGPLESSPFPPSHFPEMRNESKSSLIEADSDVKPPLITTLNTRVEEDPQNISSAAAAPNVLQDISTEPSGFSTVSGSFTTPPSTEATPRMISEEPVIALTVSISGPVEATLPQNTVELTASVNHDDTAEAPYTYEWTLVTSPDGHHGVMEGRHNKSVKISELSVGVYTVKVSVKAQQAYGESAVNFTVRSAVNINKPPKAVTLPMSQDVLLQEGPIFIINGSQSVDDAGIVSYLWEKVDGPFWQPEGPVDTPVLQLQNLSPGEYTFKLTVSDSDGLTDSSTATVRVSIPKDDPPRARAGADRVVTLPVSHLTLWGNHSTDDHAITSYLWTLHPRSLTQKVSMQDVRSPFLQLSDLQEGRYMFQLTVTDSRDQQDSDTVSVTVLPANKAPVAITGPDRQLLLPLNSITLNGSDSTDDQAIISYQWNLISGPPGLKIKDANKAVAIATGLRSGNYKFRLTVTDQQRETDSAVLTLTIKEAKSLPLVAHASGSHTLTLPNNSLVLRGSVSNSGTANVSFLWVRDEQSPAAGDVLYGSDHEAFLYLANLVEGTYLFQLRVTDIQGRSSMATATVEVRPDPREREEVELELQVGVAQVSQQQKETVVRQLAALLHVLDSDIALKGLHGQSDISTVFRFSVQGPDGTFPGPKLARLLRNQLLREKSDFLLFKVLRVDTVMCLLLCSGRGQCDPITKSCSCDPLWMENPIRRLLDDGESNCDWSVLYVTISCFVTIIFLLSISWICVCCCKRGRRTKVRKKTKYTILDNMDEQERMELQPKYNIKHRSTEHNSSLMMSESELDIEQDNLFNYGKARNRANGAVRNGDTLSLCPVEG
ncbi:dyslexia-associated protein KIAA0319-like isoform X1 [Sinocyclocheilus anshuiensis]|uniref:dyslexia-associated protein KIAA0319-like isoform X1 n=1 Tax=Sinocyclocheilus anshuiensis TaxID=1608454 RepID=UPI0007B9917E|nr:PREDICTED: dyslexia-associated protein KIAA0319-like isoform X1 [Sinocyclocheilus anshuiensis]